jgi:DNA-binding NarL/FixJ family response regulator
VTGPGAQTEERWRRPRPVRVLLDIADRALRADAADACEDAGIAVAAGAADEADVVLIDRPVATAVPAIALVPDGTRRPLYRSWPASVCAVVPADTDAQMLAAIITVVAAGYALTARRDFAEQNAGQEVEQDNEREAGTDDEEDSASGDDASSWTVPGDAVDEPGSTLSAREREVLTLLAGGASNKEIALALGLSVSTVKFHVASITGKLGARSRVDAVAIAVRAGLVMV